MMKFEIWLKPRIPAKRLHGNSGAGAGVLFRNSLGKIGRQYFPGASGKL